MIKRVYTLSKAFNLEVLDASSNNSSLKSKYSMLNTLDTEQSLSNA